MRFQKGQTILEYTVIVIIVLGCMVAMKDYVKRGIQGRWKSATDDLSSQYDPTHINSVINYSTQINSTSSVSVQKDSLDGVAGQWTTREDLSNTVDTKTGFTQVGN